MPHCDAFAFANTPDPSRFFAGAHRGALVEAIRECLISNDTLLTVLGEPGSGKTSVCRRLEQELSAMCDVVYLAHPKLSPDALLRAIATELGLPATAHHDKLDVLRRIQEHALARYAQDRRVVLLVEDAQIMSDETLEELRLLTNLEGSERSLVQGVLFAQPSFVMRLKRAALHSLDDRIARRFALRRFSLRDTQHYLRARLTGAAGGESFWVVTASAVVAIYLLSHGRPRRITRVAQGALERARGNERTRIGAWDVASAFLHAREFQAAEVRPPFAYALVGSLFAAAGLASGAWMPPSAVHSVSEPAAAVEAGRTSVQPTEGLLVVEVGAEAEPGPATTSMAASGTQPKAVATTAISVEPAMRSNLLAEQDLTALHHEARAAGQAWLRSADQRAYTIQLMFCWEDNRVQRAARDALMDKARASQLADRLYLVTTGMRKRSASMLTLGEFDSKDAALTALARLSPELSRFRPFVRRIARLQRDVFGAPMNSAQSNKEELP